MAEELLSIITGLEGYDRLWSLSEFTEHLKADDSSSEEYQYGRVFWRPERDQQQSQYELYSTCHKTGIGERIKSVMGAMASFPSWWGQYLIQYWALEVDGRHHYLTASDQPFSLGYLYRGLCLYRKQCMDRYTVVEEGAKEEQLGPVGRAYRNMHPESSPDLRLYSAKEFPLRDEAARCGLRSFLVLPVFDLISGECHGVLEVSSFGNPNVEHVLVLDRALQVAELRSTHTDFFPISRYYKSMPLKYQQPLESEISKMLESAIEAVPQLHMAQVWAPCRQCASTSNNPSCMERAAFIDVEDRKMNSCTNIDFHMLEYLQAGEFHHLQIGKGIAGALISSDSKSCFCRNLCDFSISESPLAHYAQKARLSLCFALSLESVHDCNDLYVVEFFLQSNCMEDACGDSFMRLLLRIMAVELKSFKFSVEGQLGEELLGGLSQPNAIGYHSTRRVQEQPNTLMVMEQYGEKYSWFDFTNYLQTADLCCLQPSGEFWHGWVFCSAASVPSLVKEKIELFMIGIASKMLGDSNCLVQFWAPKMEEERCCLATSDQPYALGCLGKGLALFRKQCTKHHYFIDERAKGEELGPPGRVFRNGHPEITPDLCLYSAREFSLRNHAAHCGLRKYFALPVFDLDQHECVGVLEFVEFSDFALEDIAKALEAAGLSSTHINFKPSLQANQLPPSIAESRKLALAEVEDALQLVAKIPQLYMAEVWVPYDECANINCNLSCMELALSTKNIWESHLPKFRIHHVQTRKGIVGMALASENKSCLCRNSCDFSIVEQPRAHYEQRERLDVCFAICLQSSHTGNLLYVLEFFLNQGPTNCDYFRSFLSFLLSILEKKLKSFKLASGQQLGEHLVIEVIEFSKANRFVFSELGQQDVFPFKFKLVQYGQKEHQCSTDQELQYVSDGMNSARSVAHETRCGDAAENSKKKEDSSKRTERGKRKTGLQLSLEDLKPHFGKRLKDVADELGVGRSTIKRACRCHGIHRWPCNGKQKKNPSLFGTGSASENVGDSQQNMWRSSSGNHLPLDMPLHTNVPQTNKETTQHLTVQPEAGKVIIKARYEDDIIKFQLCLSSGMDKIVEEVATRLNLKKGSFKLKYLDEDNDEILLAADVDFQLCLRSLTSAGKTCLQLFVQLIRK